MKNFDDITDARLEKLRKGIGDLFRHDESLQYLLYVIKGRRKISLNKLDTANDNINIFRAQGGRAESKEIINYIESCILDVKEKKKKDS